MNTFWSYNYINEEALEQKEESEDEKSPRSNTKTPSRIIQKDHPETQIIGNKDAVVSTRRRLMFQEQALISLVDLNNFA